MRNRFAAQIGMRWPQHSIAKRRVLNVGPFDLHVLGTPPAFVLSQDQTLHKNFIYGALLALCLSIGITVLRTSLFKGMVPAHLAFPTLFGFQGTIAKAVLRQL